MVIAGSEVIWQLLLIVVLIGVNGFFALAEIALVTIRPTQIASLVEQGVPGSRLLQRLTKDPSRFLSAIQVAITLSGFLASASATATIAQPFSEHMQALGLPPASTRWIAIVIVTVGVSYLSLVFGELVPKQLALRRPQSVALFTVRPVEWLAYVFSPIVWALSASTRLVLKILRVRVEETSTRLSEEELKRLVFEQKSLEEKEKRIIDSVFRFGDTLVREVMVPCTDVCALHESTTLREAMEAIQRTGFSRFPVYAETLDDVIGMVTAKDVLAALLEPHEGLTVADICRDVKFVPDTQNALNLLQELQQTRTHLVVVVDEYGSMAGIVTSEDLIEEIVGEIHDETDPVVEDPVIPLGDGTFSVDAGLRIEDVNDRLGTNIVAEDLYETLAGYLITRLQRIPSVGDTVEDNELVFTIQAMEENRIERVHLARVNPSKQKADLK